MSELARRERTARQIWASPGSRHDRLIAVARLVLPGAIGVLAAFLVTAPLTSGGDVSFVLDKNKVEVAHERLKIQAARYSGQDGKGQPFRLTAASAVQRNSVEPIVQLNTLAAAIRLPDGPATISAQTGRYDMDSEQVTLDGPLNFRGPNGYDLKTRDATVDLKQRTLASGGAVTGTVTQGTFSADRMRADLAERTVTLDGNARLRIVPRRTKIAPMRALLVLPLLFAAPAAAQTRHDPAAPINFGADHIELQDKANRAVLAGNVSVKQAEMTLSAARMTVAYTGQIVDGSPQVSRLDASGGVTVTRPDQTARGQYGIYDLNRRVITMLGAVTLTQGGNTVNGGRLTINLDTGRAVIDGSSVAGGGSASGGAVQSRGGRVTGTFSVPKRN